METFAVPLKDDDGQVFAHLGISRDVTDKHAVQNQLLQAQKMEAVGQLAGGIAHDFNNLLSVVTNYTRFVLDEIDMSSHVRDDLREILKAGERGATLTRQLLTFSRKEIGNPLIVNLNTLVTDMHNLLSRMIPEDVQVLVQLEPSLRHTKIDPGQFEQVLMNLAINAKDAMPNGGELKVATRNVTVDRGSVSADLSPGDYVVLDVVDTGCGMREELTSHVFEPFFTTKEVGQGTGLGLAMVWGIVNDAGGHVSVTSEVGVGSHFSVFLPATSSVAQPDVGRADDQGNNLAASMEKTILVAEDEEAVKSITDRILSRAGYRVVAFSSPIEALAEHARRPGEIDLLVTDVVMPQMSGKELSEKTGLPTVFMSGYAENVLPDVEVLREQGRFVDKPFTREGLLRAVEAVVSRIHSHELTVSAPR